MIATIFLLVQPESFLRAFALPCHARRDTYHYYYDSDVRIYGVRPRPDPLAPVVAGQIGLHAVRFTRSSVDF